MDKKIISHSHNSVLCTLLDVSIVNGRIHRGLLHRERDASLRSTMNCPRRRTAALLALLAALLTAARPSSAQQDGGRRGRGGGGGRRQRRQRQKVVEAGTWRHESVSDEPLTFDAPDDPPPTDRARLLADAAADDDDYADVDEEELEIEDHDEYDNFVDDFDEDDEGDYWGGGRTEMYDYSDDDAEEEVRHDSSYDAVDEFDTFAREERDAEEEEEEEEEIGDGDEGLSKEAGEGFSDIGEPRVVEPIARRLRRRFDDPALQRGGGGAVGDRRLAKAAGRLVQGLHNNTSPALRQQQSRRKLGCSNVKIQFKVDKYGKETTVTLLGNGRTYLKSARDVGAYQTKTMQKCVYPGRYTIKLQDSDGICCSHGKGYYKMWVNGQLVVSGGYFMGSKAHTVQIGKNWKAYMTYRDKEWLNAHNSRRRKYNGGQGYVPLRWSRSLASQAKTYAIRLGSNCKSGSLSHAAGLDVGENLAKNQGSGSWGSMYAADKIMGRWVEDELGWSYPKNAHYTQVVWRATQYVGCGESLKSYSGGHRCRVQVCRYVKPGNCAVRNGNWRAVAWDDESSCGDDCPGDGCFI